MTQPNSLPTLPEARQSEKVCKCPAPSLHRFEPLLGSKWLPASTLTVGQERGLQDLTVQIRRENEEYLVEHPEIEAMVQVFLQQLLKQKPPGGFLARAVTFFTRSAEELEADAQQFLAVARAEPEPSFSSCRLSDIYANPFPSCESIISVATSNPVASNVATSNLTTSDPTSPASPCSPSCPCSCRDILKNSISGLDPTRQ